MIKKVLRISIIRFSSLFRVKLLFEGFDLVDDIVFSLVIFSFLLNGFSEYDALLG